MAGHPPPTPTVTPPTDVQWRDVFTEQAAPGGIPTTMTTMKTIVTRNITVCDHDDNPAHKKVPVGEQQIVGNQITQRIFCRILHSESHKCIQHLFRSLIRSEKVQHPVVLGLEDIVLREKKS